MEKLKLLIVDDNKTIRDTTARYFERQPEIDVIGTASNGLDAVAVANMHRPDAVLLDLVMPKDDGFVFLESMNDFSWGKPNVIVLTAIAIDEIISRAIDMGASYYMLKPFDYDVLLRRVKSLKRLCCETAQVASPASSAVNNQLSELLLREGIPAHLKGYRFLFESVQLVMDNLELCNRLTKELYPLVAHKFSTTSVKVERSMRHAISAAWEHPNASSSSFYEKPTSGEFILSLVNRLKQYN